MFNLIVKFRCSIEIYWIALGIVGAMPSLTYMHEYET